MEELSKEKLIEFYQYRLARENEVLQNVTGYSDYRDIDVRVIFSVEAYISAVRRVVALENKIDSLIKTEVV
jgi:hypothetical protein